MVLTDCLISRIPWAHIVSIKRVTHIWTPRVEFSSSFEFRNLRQMNGRIGSWPFFLKIARVIYDRAMSGVRFARGGGHTLLTARPFPTIRKH